MKSLSTLLFLLSIVVSISCKNESKTPEVKTVETAEQQEKYPMPAMDAKFKDEKTEAVFVAYQKLQNALVNTDAASAVSQAKVLVEALKSKEASESQIEAVKMMASTNDIEEQRSAFVKVTSVVEEYLSDALESGTLYKVHCPMAFKNKGASWLSSEKVVQNPYFGNKMYRCGRIEEAIQ